MKLNLLSDGKDEGTVDGTDVLWELEALISAGAGGMVALHSCSTNFESLDVKFLTFQKKHDCVTLMDE